MAKQETTRLRATLTHAIKVAIPYAPDVAVLEAVERVMTIPEIAACARRGTFELDLDTPGSSFPPVI